MTLFMGAAVAIGVTYACIAPWFLCYPNKNEEESQIRNSQESDNNVSSADQTLTSTNIRITGLRGLNFVSVTMPNHPAFKRMSSRNLEASSNLRSISNENFNGEHVSEEYPLINRHQDEIRQSSLPTIHISSASTDTTVYPLSSEMSLHSLENDKSALRISQIISTDSNNSPCDAIRSYDVEDNCFKIIQTLPKIRKPPRAHPPNSRLSHQDSGIPKQDSVLSLNEIGSGVRRKMQRNNFVDNKNEKVSCGVERKLHSMNLSGTSSKIVGVNLSCDRTKRHSLYPDVVVRNNSSSTTVSSYLDDYKKSGDVVEKPILISEYSTSSPGKIADQLSSSVEKLEIVSDKSRNKSRITKFFRKKCKKIWKNVNKNNNFENSIKSQISIESITKNHPASHSTFNENSHLPGEVQGQLSEFKCKSEILQGHCENCHIKNMNMTNKKFNMYKQHFDSRGIPCFCALNSHETIKLKKISSIFSNIPPFQEEITNHRSSSCSRKIFEYIDDEPLDLSTKSKVFQSDNNTENINNNIDNNCSPETISKHKLKQRSNLIFSNSFNNKFFKKRKCQSLSESNQTNILGSISRLCYRSQ